MAKFSIPDALDTVNMLYIKYKEAAKTNPLYESVRDAAYNAYTKAKEIKNTLGADPDNGIIGKYLNKEQLTSLKKVVDDLKTQIKDTVAKVNNMPVSDKTDAEKVVEGLEKASGTMNGAQADQMAFDTAFSSNVPRPYDAMKHCDNSDERIMELLTELDKKDHPEKYSTKEKADARIKEIKNDTDAISATRNLVEKDMKAHPEFYVDPKDANDRFLHCAAHAALKEALVLDSGFTANMAKEMPSLGLDNPEKTFTDLYKGPNGTGEANLDTLVQRGFIRDNLGNPINVKGNRPWSSLETVTSMVNSDIPLYAEVPGAKQVYKIDRTNVVNNKESAPKPLPGENNKLVNPKVKAATIKQLMEVKKSLDEIKITKNTSKNIVALKNEIQETITDLKGTALKGTFDSRLKKFAENAEQYVMNGSDKKLSKNRMNKLNICERITQIKESVEKDKVPQNDAVKEMRSLIAARAVKAFAGAYKDSKNPQYKNMANHINSNPQAFRAEVEKAMNNPGFIAMFGSDKHPVDLANLQAAVKETGSNLIKSVQSRQLQLSNEELKAIKDPMTQRKAYKRGPNVNSPASKADIQTLVSGLNKELNELSGKASSPEFEQFRDELEIANMMLQDDWPGTNPSEILNNLANAASPYYNKLSSSDSLKNGNQAKRFGMTVQVLNAADLVNSGQSLKNMPSTLEMQKEHIAAKSLKATYENMMRTGTPNQKAKAKATLSNPEAFRKQTQKLMKSDAFKNLTGDEKDLSSLMSKSGQEIADKLSKEQKKIIEKDPNLSKEQKEYHKKVAEEKVHDMEDTADYTKQEDSMIFSMGGM